MKEINPSVPNEVGRWVLEPLSIYNPYSGVTISPKDLTE